MFHYPATSPSGALVVLAHGAGAGQRHPFMAAVSRGLAVRGIDVFTFDFPYMDERRRVPDKAPILERSFLNVIDAVRSREHLSKHRLFIGGKSMGGRIATHLGAQGIASLSGIIALGYPLHPPGKPDQKRVAHLPSIRVPLLIVQGERDTFGTPQELGQELKTMNAPVTLHVVEGGDHSLSVRGRGREDVYGQILDFTARWMTSVT